MGKFIRECGLDEVIQTSPFFELLSNVYNEAVTMMISAHREMYTGK
jgi:hypothetical protein